MVVGGYTEFDLNTIVNDVDGDNLDISFITQNYGSYINTLFNGVTEIWVLFSHTYLLLSCFFGLILGLQMEYQNLQQTLTFNLFGRELPMNIALIAFDQDVI